MHFLTLPFLLLTASLSTALVLQPRQNADGAQDGCHVTDYISQCPSSGTADVVSAKCSGWCWPAVAGGPSAVGTWDPLYCGKCLDSFILLGGANAAKAYTCAAFMTKCGVQSNYATVYPVDLSS